MKPVQNSLRYALLFFLICTAFYLRSFALHRDLFFGYDQGRDAFAMQRIASGDIPFIGPVTGLEGVFLGPFYYYVLFPAYALADWNPMGGAYLMIFLSLGVVLLLIVWGKKLGSPWIGYAAATIYVFSNSNIAFSRWLSNPTPLPFFALLLFYFFSQSLIQKKYSLFLVTGIFIGLCFQLEAANAVWYIPTVVLLLCVEIFSSAAHYTQKIRAFLSQGAMVFLGFCFAELPHIAFEFRNHFLITKNALFALTHTQGGSLLEILPQRLVLLSRLYSRGIFVSDNLFLALSFIFFSIMICFAVRRSFFESVYHRVVLAWFLVPFLFHATFTGNHGNFWDYYIIAQHPVLYLLLASAVYAFTRVYRSTGKVVLMLSSAIFFISILSNLYSWFQNTKVYADRFSLDVLEQSAKWMAQNSHGKEYGVWVYAPNASDEPHRYVYWLQERKTGLSPVQHTEQANYIFLAVEDDPVNWLRRKEWIEEKKKFGIVVEKRRFGAIMVYMIENTWKESETK